MIALGCDHGGYELKQEIKKYLDEKGIEYKDYGCDSLDSVDYPVYAKKVAHAILDGECEKGILICGTQWFERTLDDSANKRLSIPEGFLAIDGILDLCLNVVDGLVVYPKVIEKHMMAELPFMATENIMMDAVKAGGDRQELHERIRELSMEAGKTVKVEGKDNNLLELIAADPAFNLSLEDLQRSMDPKKYIGRAKEQTERFVNTVVQPILDSHKELLGVKAEINV